LLSAQGNDINFNPDSKAYQKQERPVVGKGTSNKMAGPVCNKHFVPLATEKRGVSEGICNRKVRQEGAKTAKG